MDLHHLKIFHIVARNLSFSKTAYELHISQPAISMQIKNLEDELGFKLLERYGRTIFLSKEGQIMYSYTQKIFDLVTEMESEVNIFKGKMVGKISIGASNTPGIHVLPQIIGLFKEKHPDVKVNLHIGSTSEIHSKLIENELDFAIIGGEIDLHKTFIVEKLVEDILVLIVSPSNPLSSHEYIDRKMLTNQQYITHEESSQLYKAMEKLITKMKLPFNVVMTLGSIHAITHAVAANIGISFVPYTSVHTDIRMGLLKKVSVENKVWKYPYSLVYNQKKNFTAPILIILEMVRSQIKRIMAG